MGVQPEQIFRGEEAPPQNKAQAPWHVGAPEAGPQLALQLQLPDNNQLAAPSTHHTPVPSLACASAWNALPNLSSLGRFLLTCQESA